MIDYIDDGGSSKSTINVYIGDEEWNAYSYQNKLRFLYRLRQSQSPLAKSMEKSIGLLIEEERASREVDIAATLKQIESGE